MPDYRSVIRERLRAARLNETLTVEIVEEVAAHLGDVHAASLAGGASEAEATRAALAELDADRPLHRALPRRPSRAASTRPSPMTTWITCRLCRPTCPLFRLHRCTA